MLGVAEDGLQDPLGFPTQLIRGRHGMDQPDFEGFLTFIELSAEDHFHGPPHPDQPGKPLGSASAGNDAHLDLRQTDPGFLAGHPQVAGHGEFKPAAETEAVDRRHQDQRGVFQAVEELLDSDRKSPGSLGRHCIISMPSAPPIKYSSPAPVKMMARARPFSVSDNTPPNSFMRAESIELRSPGRWIVTQQISPRLSSKIPEYFSRIFSSLDFPPAPLPLPGKGGS